MNLIQSAPLVFLLKILFILASDGMLISAAAIVKSVTVPEPAPPDIYTCSVKMVSNQNVRSGSAKLTKGCELDGNDVTFVLSSMYNRLNPPGPKVVVEITEANFISSRIMIIDAKNIPDAKKNIPFIFTIDKTKMSGTSQLCFGDNNEEQKGVFKLPPKSRISILGSTLTISSKEGQFGVITFFSLQIISNSIIKIANNVINMEYVTGHKAVFFLPQGSDMKISDGSSFILMENEIHLNAKGDITNDFKLHTRVWCQAPQTHLTISENSHYTWESNNISMVGNSLGGITQYVWHHSGKSSLVISQSTYKWVSNKIRVVGYNIRIVLFQSILRNHDDSLLRITQNSKYTLTGNTMNTIGYDVIGDLFQYIWMAISEVTISDTIQFLLESNKMYMVADNYKTLASSMMMISKATGAVSKGSSMIIKKNCLGMVQKKTDKRNVFTGKWAITDKSKLEFDGNYFTTTSEYNPDVSSDMTSYMWGPTGATDIAIKDSTLSISATQLNGNSPIGGTSGSSVWHSALSTYNADVKQPSMEWSLGPAKDKNGDVIPTLEKSNVEKYMCVPLATGTSYTSNSNHICTIPAVIISSVVFLYFFM